MILVIKTNISPKTIKIGVPKIYNRWIIQPSPEQGIFPMIIKTIENSSTKIVTT